MDLRDLARELATIALQAVDPERLVREALAARPSFTPEAVLALGKAAAAMARGADIALADRAPRRLLLIRPHASRMLGDPAWEELTGGHPIPDEGSLAAGRRLAAWLGDSPQLLALISGGGSACLELPAGELMLPDLVATHRALLGAGLPIGATNAVRKHLSALKGGGALRLTRGRVLALLLSDVPGDDPGTIASGPFAADRSTYAEALEAVRGLELPEAVRAHLEAGRRGAWPETVKPGDPELARVETALLGSAATAAGAVLARARELGFAGAAGPLAGGAREAARELVARGRGLPGPAAALVLAGETVVTLAGPAGHGGRNQELALAAARELAGSRGEVVLALATDGVDGETDAAGGVVDGNTWEAVRRAGVDPEAALTRYDSHTALAAAPGALLTTGPTGTNVADLAVYLRWDE